MNPPTEVAGFHVGEDVTRGNGRTVYEISGFWRTVQGEWMAHLTPVEGYTNASGPVDQLHRYPHDPEWDAPIPFALNDVPDYDDVPALANVVDLDTHRRPAPSSQAGLATFRSDQ